MWDIVFLANAIGAAYEEFLIPFTFFALVHHPRGFVEMVVVNQQAFLAKYAREIDELIALGYTRFLIRSMDRPPNGNHILNTYVMDVDVMLLEHIVPAFEQHWPEGCVCNNTIRDASAPCPRMTGMMMVNTSQYFTAELMRWQDLLYRLDYAHGVDASIRKNTNDEHVLYWLVKACHAPLPPEKGWRPIFGIHFSPNRGPGKAMHLKTSDRYKALFGALAERHAPLFAFPVFRQLCHQLGNLFV